VLPYIGLETDTVLTGAENLLHLSRADIIRMAGPGELADGERYRLVLEGLGYSSIEIRAGDPQFSSAVVEASTRRTLIWYARLDSTPVAQSVLDSLASVCQTGSHLIITGQNLLEFNSAHALFQQNLGVAFAGNYAITGFNAQMTGVAGNPVGNGLTFQFLRAAQPSPDRLTLLSTGAARAFTYGTDATDTSLTAGVTVDNTGGGGKALVMGINLEIASGALVAEVLRRTFAYFEGTTEVDDHGSGEPGQFALYGNYPNPFNPTTTISFWLPRAEPVTLRVYSILGQEVATLLDGEFREAGLHRVSWDGAGRHGGTLAGGVYVCRIEAGRWVASTRMLLLK